MLSRTLLLSALAATALAVDVCYKDNCCSGSIIGGCSNDLSDFICCVGDTGHNIEICVGNGKPTCSAGTATPLTAAGGSTVVIGTPPASTSMSVTVSTTAGSASPTASASGSSGLGLPGTTQSFNTYGTGTTQTPQSTTAMGGSGASASASSSPSSTGNGAASRYAIGGLALGAMPLMWLLGA